MGRHSRHQNLAPAVPQAPEDNTLPESAAWVTGTDATTSSAPSRVSSRRYGAVAALAAATALSAVALTSEPSNVPSASAAQVSSSLETPLSIVTTDPDTSAEVTIVADGQALVVTTDADTWGQVLTENDIKVGSDDIVSEDLGADVTDGGRITIERVTFEDVVEEETQGFETIRQEDDTLEKGTEKVLSEGAEGVTRTTYRVKLIDGVEDSREKTITAKVSDPQDRVIAVGTKEEVVEEVTPEPEPAAETPTETPEPAAATAEPEPEPAPAQPVVVNAGGTKGIAQQMVAAKGWSNSEFQCLETLWQRESGWNHLAQNPSSGAYGIPQALPGSKMASHGADWQTNPATQIAWGLDYIQGRYGTPCGALGHSNSRGWY